MNTQKFLQTALTAALTGAFSLNTHAGECNPGFDPDAALSNPGLQGLGGFPFDINGASQMAVFDDGTGPALYVAGVFTHAGGQQVNQIAKWDGKNWSSLGGGIGTSNYIAVQRMLVFDDGSGPALYVAGHFAGVNTVPGTSNIARWDGENWSSVGGGVNDRIMDIAIFDDGSGPQLYAGGWFSNAGGVPVTRLARWDGTQWSAVPGANGIFTEDVTRLIAWDDGDGADLYVSGDFRPPNGSPASHIAKWDGSRWSMMDGGANALIISLKVVNLPGQDEALYVGGNFTEVGNGIAASHIARWDGISWSALSGDPQFALPPDSVGEPWIWTMEVFDDGDGPKLWVSGGFTLIDDVPAESIARWDGTSWETFVPGLGVPGQGGGIIFDAEVFDDGSGPDLYFTGLFISGLAGHPTNGIGVWRGCYDELRIGDLNGDGAVDVIDLLQLLGAWGDCSNPRNCPADLNDDGTVNVQDLLALLANWG